jgi:FkbM family methyltransferase
MQTNNTQNSFLKHKLEKNPIYQIVLKYMSQKYEIVNFLQIGAFDGVSYDEMHDTVCDDLKFKGLLIEPMQTPFQELLKTYQHRTDWKFENIAITEKKEIRQVWTIPYELKNSENVPDWAIGCSTLLQNSNSLFGKHCNKAEFDALKKFTKIEFVQCDYLESILLKHDFLKHDIIQIDTEGYDWLIIKQLNLENNCPKVINFEFFNLTNEHYNEAITFLNLYNYSLYKYSNNIIAFHKNFITELNLLNDIEIDELLKKSLIF